VSGAVRAAAIATAVIGAAAAGSATGRAATGRVGTFRTPSGNIVCQHYVPFKTAETVAVRPSVECGIRSGLVGVRPARSCAGGDPIVNRVFLSDRGRGVRVRCAGDPGPFLATTAPVLAYGKAWRSGGIACASARTGLTCTNRDGHGFFLSRQRWRMF
jgi:uncharacterized protein DUF6636